MKLFELEEQVVRKLALLYDKAEAVNIADWVLESLTGRNRAMRNMDKSISLPAERLAQLEGYMVELMEYRPVQYVLGESYFYGLKLFVDEHVLIPRPETEELADWVVQYGHARGLAQPVVLDIGTGSGCLALAIKKGIPGATVYAADVSAGALEIAAKNAALNHLELNILPMDILRPEQTAMLPLPDIIVSNPPYITLPEQDSILPNVLRYEPHQALFVTDNDPLQFYKAIAAFAGKNLAPEGAVFLEMHRDFAADTQQYFTDLGWQTLLKKDMQGEDRMLQVSRSGIQE